MNQLLRRKRKKNEQNLLLARTNAPGALVDESNTLAFLPADSDDARFVNDAPRLAAVVVVVGAVAAAATTAAAAAPRFAAPAFFGLAAAVFLAPVLRFLVALLAFVVAVVVVVDFALALLARFFFVPTPGAKR